jgi:hypothetical protein
MHRCEDCNDLFLDYLYGLLDPGQTQVLLDHLENCAPCQAALAEAERHQQLLARAAQISRHVPMFNAPAEQVPDTAITPIMARQPAEPPATIPLPTTSRRLGRRVAWIAAAAAVLLAVTGVYGWYRNERASHQATLLQAQHEVEKVDTRLALVPKDYEERIAAPPKTSPADVLRLQVFGPATYQPRAAGSYHVLTRDRDGKSTAAQVTARVIDPGRGLIVFDKTYTSNGELVLHLPGDVHLEPKSSARLEVTATSRAAQETLQHELAVVEPGYTTHVTLSKPAYRPGEMLFFRTLTLERFALEPPPREINLQYVLRDPSGRVVRKITGPTRHGIGGGEWAIADDLVSGDYALEVSEATMGGSPSSVVPQSRRLHIARDAAPHLEFDRPHYRPGETVNAQYRGRVLGNGAVVPQQPLTVTARAAGKPISLPGAPAGMPLQMRTDDSGKAAIQFQLPSQVPGGGAEMEIQVHDGNLPEKTVHSIPVTDAQPFVEFFPEGGELVAGLPNRVYVRAVPGTSPATIAGSRVLNERQEVIATLPAAREPQPLSFSSTGIVTLTPSANEQYTLQSANKSQTTKLPMVRESGVVLRVTQSVTRSPDPLALTVFDTEADRRLLVVASCRGRVVDQQLVVAGRAGSAVRLTPVPATRGVVRVTVYEPRAGQLLPLAERLVYREPAEYLDLSVAVRNQLKPFFQPGQRVDLSVTARDEARRDLSAWLLAAVVDEKALEVADRGADAGMPAHFLLTNPFQEAEHLEDADVLLAKEAPARQALDLFMGTHGWRRFVAAPVQTTTRRADHRLGESIPADQPAIFVTETSDERVQSQHAAALANHNNALRQEMTETLNNLHEQRAQRDDEARLAAAELGAFEQSWQDRLRLAVLTIIALLLLAGVAGLVLGWIRLLRGSSSRTALGLAMACFGLCVATYLATSGLRSADDARPEDHRLAARPDPKVRDRGDENFKVKGPIVAKSDATGQRPVQGLYVAKAPPAPQPSADLGSRVAPEPPKTLAHGEALMASAYTDAEMFLSHPGALAPPLKKRFQEAQLAQAKEGFGTGGFATSMQFAKVAPPANGGKTAKSTAGLQEPPYRFSREYAHQHSLGSRDVQDTVLWHPVLQTTDGQANVSFDLSSSVTTYRVLIYGHDASGRVGSYRGKLDVRK